ncbi:tetratricopeptide repeat protein [Streptomyces ortus]|uniref:Tetratricopeptide repeat protein n=1 Tax=Streptomyces ortus TaxID=2867268 RepID=A0ABT3V3W9_9ACTN|nr:tetratricopeptide repeat protein [Streptomyces ortus]MCX4234657.1 tetratricopeptide repeat protein [Streptomyces ortus]
MSRPLDDHTDFDALRRAMQENYEQPEGPARNARAEQLLTEAEKLNIPLAVIEALGHQLKVYNYSSEKDRMFVPFARLLRMWDERPEDFDAYETHSLHWVFKWVSSGMLGQPHIPLASIEKWLGEMEHRYRLAGHSERAVRAAEFHVAREVGDLGRAERAYAAWLAADRDTMADCHACELHDQGGWRAERGADAEALDLWRPVLEGEYTCAHEPHAVLASSLLPLLHLGRTEEARAHHLRGFRLVRPMESMRGAYADHVEFCALSGNEARALELLAERPSYFTDSGEPRSRMDFLAVAALLADRLTALGLGTRAVPGPAGRTWTAAELAAHARVEALSLAGRFDARNGTTRVSERVRRRMDRQPLVERLPLGIRAAARTGGVTAFAAAPVRPAAAPVAEDAAELPALLAEARRLSASLHPGSVAAWAAVAEAVGEAGDLGGGGAVGAVDGLGLTSRDRAEMTDHEAMGLGPEGVELFARAAGLYEEAGDPGEALAARARGAYALALSGRSEEALAAVSEPYERVLALFAEGATGLGQAASVLVGRARILLRRVHEAAGTNGLNGGSGGVPKAVAAARTAARAAARELLALAGPGAGDDLLVASRAAEAQAMLGELAALSGNAEQAAELLTAASEAFVAAGVPWFAAEYEARLTGLARQLGDAEAAERAARAALEHGAPYMEAVGHAQLHLQLAEILGATGRFGPAADHALEASHWADEGGESATLGAWARHQLGGFLLRRERWAEAAEVLESALAELSAETHGEGAIVQTRWWLGDCLTELGEYREAAEHWLRAADIARRWPEQQDHATLAHLAAEALGQAGLDREAELSYERAGELWATLGNVHGLVRSLRARAWLTVRGRDGGGPEDARDAGASEGGAGVDGARELMGRAVGVCEAGVAGAEDEEGARESLVAELAHTHRQFGDLVARSVPDDAEDETIRALFEEALEHFALAVSGFRSLGADALHDRTGAQLAAGWIEADLDRPGWAAGRAREVVSAYADVGAGVGVGADEVVAVRVAEAERLLRATEGF